MIDITTLCEENGYPAKVEALLHHLCLQGEDEDDYDITYPYENHPHLIEVNETVYYLFSEDESSDYIIDYEEMIQEEISADIPEWIRNYINWESYWDDAQLDLSEVTGCSMDEIYYLGQTYYYGETDY